MKRKSLLIVGATIALAISGCANANVVTRKNPLKAAEDTTRFELINSTTDLEAGKSYIITNGTSGSVKAISTADNSNNRKTTSVTVSDGKITRGANVMSFTLGGETGAWTFATDNYLGTAGYLASASSGKNNYLRVIANAGNATIGFSGDAAVINIGPHTERTLLRYNTSDLFACYSSGQEPVYLWKEIAGAAPVTYTVTYDANGGNGTLEDQNSPYSPGATVTTLNNTFQRLGYLFNCWNTEPDGSGTGYDEGDTFTINSHTTLYATWDVDTSFAAISFGKREGSLSINAIEKTGNDTFGNTWTISTAGTTSFTQNDDYSQIGSSSNPATSISFTTTLQKQFSVTSFTAKLGGFSGTAGNVTMKVGNETVATDSLNASNDVVVSSSSSAVGSSLSISITDIAKGIKAYYITYTLNDNVDIDYVSITGLPAQGSVYVGDTLNLGSTIEVSSNGDYSEDVTWESDDESVATVSNLGVVTGVAEGTANITVTADDDPNVSMTCVVTVTTAPLLPDVNKTIADIIGTPVPAEGTQYLSLNFDSVITVSVSSGGDNGKVYSSGTEWRVYQSAHAVVTISAKTGYLVTAISFTYGNKNGGVLVYDEDTLNSGNTVSVNSLSSVQVSAGNSGSATNGRIDITAIGVSYVVNSNTTAREVVETYSTYASLSYDFTDSGSGAIDRLDRTVAGITTTTNYADWPESLVLSSGITYLGHTAGSNNAIQLKNGNDSGIVVSNNANDAYAKKITIKFSTSTTANQAVEIYGKNEKYTAVADLYNSNSGSIIGEIPYDAENNIGVVTIADNYEYIGIKSQSGAVYLEEIAIQWGDISYTYNDVAIRFGGRLSQELWGQLDRESTIEGYGILLSTPEYLNGAALKTKFDVATPEGPQFKKFDANVSRDPVEDGSDYYWNLYKRFPTSFVQEFVAVAYIRINGDVVFFNEVTASPKTAAKELINDKTYDLDAFNGSLANMACLPLE